MHSPAQTNSSVDAYLTEQLHSLLEKCRTAAYLPVMPGAK